MRRPRRRHPAPGGAARHAGVRCGALVAAFQERDAVGQLAYRVYYFAALTKTRTYKRDNAANARRQHVQPLLAQWTEVDGLVQSGAAGDPARDRAGLDAASDPLAVYRFAIEDLYRQQAHVLDAAGERLLALSAQFGNAADDSYDALATADAKFPTITLSTGEEVQATYARYRAILATNRVQADRAMAFAAHHQPFADHQNTYASLYNGVLQRDWFHTQARGYATTWRPRSTATRSRRRWSKPHRGRAGRCRAVAPLRSAAARLGLDHYHLYDGTIPLVELDRRYPYDDVPDWIVESVAALGAAYQARVRAGSARVDQCLREPGKAQGRYSASVTVSIRTCCSTATTRSTAVFTLAHEMGHSMHTMLTHERSRSCTRTTPSSSPRCRRTLNEALLLDFMLARGHDPRERAVLLQHAIDEHHQNVLPPGAVCELRARGSPSGRARRADHRPGLSTSIAPADRASTATPWPTTSCSGHLGAHPALLRIAGPVYQYATCFASSAQAAAGRPCHRSGRSAPTAVRRFLDLLRAGSEDHPMALLQAAGVDLPQPETVAAIVKPPRRLVSRLETELDGSVC